MAQLERFRYSVRASAAIVADPYEGLERTLERIAEWREGRTGPWAYQATENYDQALHALIGAAWPCPVRDEFEELWARILGSLQARGLQVGRGAYGGWDDADPALARSVWCLSRHLRPEVVVETGVARGLTTRVVLEALERNEAGRLCSIDMPPLLEQDLAEEVGAAVSPELRSRWMLLRGSSRRCLPSLVNGLSQIHLPVNLFIHDSMHTARNLGFELDRVWPAVADGGAVLVDDVEKNVAFRSFTSKHPEAAALVCTADDGRAQLGCLVRSTNAKGESM